VTCIGALGSKGVLMTIVILMPFSWHMNFEDLLVISSKIQPIKNCNYILRYGKQKHSDLIANHLKTMIPITDIQALDDNYK